MTERELLKDKKRIVIKIGSSSLTHAETGDLNLAKIEKLVRVISDMRGMGKEVILVSSGAIATGRQTLGGKKPETVAEKQAYAAVGQARLMMVYQKLFSEYNQTAAQILITKATILDDTSRANAKNTFNELPPSLRLLSREICYSFSPTSTGSTRMTRRKIRMQNLSARWMT